MKNIYFDHAATTPMHPEVIQVMLEHMQGHPSNPSSMHAYGRAGKSQLSQARDRMSAALGCKPSELLFTSGGTESNNTALIGAARAQRKRGKSHIITSAAEHHAVLHTCEWLSKEEGFELTILPVDDTGLTSVEQVKDALKPETGLVSIMYGNNEVGTVQPIQAIGEAVQQYGALMHVDAVQALGWMSERVGELPVDLMSFSAHKINGPKGVGALYIAEGSRIEPILFGGSQERKRRAGTENVAGIAGFAAALDICVNERKFKQPFLDKLRTRWIELLQQQIAPEQIRINGHPKQRLPHIINISFIGVDTESMLMNLDLEGIAAASGSACTSGALEKSHVLRAMQVSAERLHSAVRFSFGLGNTLEEIEEAAPIVAKIVNRIRPNK